MNSFKTGLLDGRRLGGLKVVTSLPILNQKWLLTKALTSTVFVLVRPDRIKALRKVRNRRIRPRLRLVVQNSFLERIDYNPYPSEGWQLKIYPAEA